MIFNVKLHFTNYTKQNFQQPIQNSTRKPVVSRQMSSGKPVVSQSTEDRTAQWVANIPSDFPINNEVSLASIEFILTKPKLFIWYLKLSVLSCLVKHFSF